MRSESGNVTTDLTEMKKTIKTSLRTPVFLPGESQGRASLVGCRLQSDTTEVT